MLTEINKLNTRISGIFMNIFYEFMKILKKAVDMVAQPLTGNRELEIASVFISIEAKIYDTFAQVLRNYEEGKL